MKLPKELTRPGWNIRDNGNGILTFVKPGISIIIPYNDAAEREKFEQLRPRFSNSILCLHAAKDHKDLPDCMDVNITLSEMQKNIPLYWECLQMNGTRFTSNDAFQEARKFKDNCSIAGYYCAHPHGVISFLAIQNLDNQYLPMINNMLPDRLAAAAHQLYYNTYDDAIVTEIARPAINFINLQVLPIIAGYYSYKYKTPVSILEVGPGNAPVSLAALMPDEVSEYMGLDLDPAEYVILPEHPEIPSRRILYSDLDQSNMDGLPVIAVGIASDHWISSQCMSQIVNFLRCSKNYLMIFLSFKKEDGVGVALSDEMLGELGAQKHVIPLGPLRAVFIADHLPENLLSALTECVATIKAASKEPTPGKIEPRVERVEM